MGDAADDALDVADDEEYYRAFPNEDPCWDGEDFDPFSGFSFRGELTRAQKTAYAVNKTRENDLDLLVLGLFDMPENKEKTKMTHENKTAKKQLGPTDCLTPEFRASYLNAFEARAADPSKPAEKNYGVEMWFRVAHTPESQAAGEKLVDIKDLEKAAMAACGAEWGADQAKWPKGFKHPFKKGENNTGKNGPIPGVMIVRSNRKEKFGRPVVVDQNVQDVIDQKQVYSGCYMRAKIHAYAWKHQTGGAGVSFTLDMLQLVRDGEPLGNRMNAEDAFSAIPLPAGGASAAPAKAGVAAAPETAGNVFGELA